MSDGIDAKAVGRGTLMTGSCLLQLIAVGTQVFACYDFMEHYWGWHWAVCIAVMSVLFFFKATLLITAGCFFGALLVWKWPWWGALLLAAPGIVIGVLALLGVLGGVGISQLRGSVRHHSGLP